MSIGGKAKEAAGFVKEEMNEHKATPEDKAKAQEGRDLRNEGRVEDGKAPKSTEPCAGHKESNPNSLPSFFGGSFAATPVGYAQWRTFSPTALLPKTSTSSAL